jgi:hypothetical protein
MMHAPRHAAYMSRRDGGAFTREMAGQFIHMTQVLPLSRLGYFRNVLLDGRVELRRQSRLAGRQICLDLRRSCQIDFGAEAVVSGPPEMVGEPVAGAVVAHIDDAFADGLALAIERLDADEEVLGGVAVQGSLGLGGLSRDLLGHFVLTYEIDVFGLSVDSRATVINASQVKLLMPPRITEAVRLPG